MRHYAVFDGERYVGVRIHRFVGDRRTYVEIGSDELKLLTSRAAELDRRILLSLLRARRG